VPDELDATLVLVRHGQSTFVAEGRFQGRLDPPLSPLGERQAAQVATWLAAGPEGPHDPGLVAPAVRIVHSPLSRAAGTAHLIADAQRPAPPLVADDAFTEIGQGEWEGHTMAEVTRRWGELLAAWRRSPTTAWAPGGEPLAVADRRVRAGLERVLGSLTGDEPASAGPGARPWVIVVAHDGILRLLLLALLDLPLERFWSFPFALCGATVVELRDGRAQLLAHNLAGHLAGLDAGPPRDGAF
jgi:probable phosphoglycerate mutase